MRHAVIMAGGVGVRLWPLSRKRSPKQLLKIFEGKSLLRRSYERVATLLPPEQINIITNAAHLKAIAEEIPELPADNLFGEPEGRDTANAVGLSAAVLLERDPEAVVGVFTADHIISPWDAFKTSVERALQTAEENPDALVTMGIRPTRPDTNYGYVKRGAQTTEGVFEVEKFTEKPNVASAMKYVASGKYYWNSGMFLFSAQVFLDELERLNPAMLEGCRASLAEADKDLDFLRLAAAPFEALKGDSIDYAVMEHTDHAAVMPIDVGWSDLGAWGALWEIGEQDEAGNVLVGDALVHDTRNTYIRSDARLVTAVGVENLIIVATEDAVLVADRDKAEAVRHIVKALADLGRSEVDAHVRVLRPWGAFEGIKKGPGYQVKVLTVNPGAGISLQYHNQRAEHWVVVSGHARVTRDDDVMDLAPNESTYIPLRAVHQLENPGDVPLQVVEVQTGDYLGEDDIVRIEDRYGRG